MASSDGFLSVRSTSSLFCWLGVRRTRAPTLVPRTSSTQTQAHSSPPMHTTAPPTRAPAPPPSSARAPPRAAAARLDAGRRTAASVPGRATNAASALGGAAGRRPTRPARGALFVTHAAGDYYDTLGVPRDADMKTIKQAYR